jgi:arylsulfatase A-like enzyme
VPQELARKVIDQYDTAIANLDEQVGALLDRLRDKGLADETIVVITSDHGEYFGTHHLVAHSKDVYQGALRVPLLIRGPGPGEPAVDDIPVAANDLPSLILSRLPASYRDRWPGAFPDSPGNHPVIAENYYTRRKDLFHPVWGDRFWRIRRAVFEWPYKLILSSDGNHELYDLEQDAAESNNLIDEEPALAERLGDELRAFMSERGTPKEQPDLSPIDETLEQQLRSLGYLGN